MAREAAELEEQLTAIASSENTDRQPTESEEATPASAAPRRCAPTICPVTCAVKEVLLGLCLTVAKLHLPVADLELAMLCRAGQDHRRSSAPHIMDTLQEKDIEAILGIVCNDTSTPSIWGVSLQLLNIP